MINKIMGIASPGVENVGVPRGSILELSRASQLSYNKTIIENIYTTNRSEGCPNGLLNPWA